MDGEFVKRHLQRRRHFVKNLAATIIEQRICDNETDLYGLLKQICGKATRAYYGWDQRESNRHRRDGFGFISFLAQDRDVDKRTVWLDSKRCVRHSDFDYRLHRFFFYFLRDRGFECKIPTYPEHYYGFLQSDSSSESASAIYRREADEYWC